MSYKYRPISEISDADKIAAFDKLYHTAENQFREITIDHREGDDGKHYIYEAVMSLTLGDGVWGAICEAMK